MTHTIDCVLSDTTTTPHTTTTTTTTRATSNQQPAATATATAAAARATQRRHHGRHTARHRHRHGNTRALMGRRTKSCACASGQAAADIDTTHMITHFSVVSEEFMNEIRAFNQDLQ